jgi:hypothetical protein
VFNFSASGGRITLARPLDQDSLHYFVSRWLEKIRHAADGHDAPFVDEFIFAYIAFNAADTAAAYVVDGG